MALTGKEAKSTIVTQGMIRVKVLIELDKLISTQKEKCKNLGSGGKYKKMCCIERRRKGELES